MLPCGLGSEMERMMYAHPDTHPDPDGSIYLINWLNLLEGKDTINWREILGVSLNCQVLEYIEL